MFKATAKFRRDFLGLAAAGVAAAELAMLRCRRGFPARATGRSATSARPSGHTSFASLKQVGAGLLSVGYAEAGPAGGQVVVLLHGWPYDIHSYVDVAPLLAAAGYRVIRARPDRLRAESPGFREAYLEKQLASVELR